MVFLPALAVAGNPSAPSSHAIAMFDETVAAGLPRAVALPTSAKQARGSASESELLIESPLDIELHFPGDVPATMYTATWQGEPAVVTRSDGHLDITVLTPDGVAITGYSDDAEEPHHASPDTMSRETDPPASHDVATTSRGTRASRPVDRMTFDANAYSWTRPKIVFWMFQHDDTLDIRLPHIHAGYVAWWLADMMKIVPTRQLAVIYSENVEGVTDMAYGHPSSLEDWSRAIKSYALQENLPWLPGKMDFKFMLLTKNLPVPNATGVAWHGGDQAMGSLNGRYTIVAHEYGHSLGTMHDDAEIFWNRGWPCESNMIAVTTPLRANCYRYTAKNERNIRVFLAREWSSTLSPNIPDIPKNIADEPSIWPPGVIRDIPSIVID
ncbi:hypothetical protein [Luteibacter rhizovicinus]|nr:hypothetical protein [Luteibacter rhizovicinus]